MTGRTVAIAALALLPLQAAADDGLMVFDWGGYEDPSFFPAYVEKHGKTPEFGFYSDDDEAFSKLMSGFRADVAHPCAQVMPKYRDAGLIEPWDLSRIPAAADIDQRLLGSPVLRDDAGVWLIPAEWGATAITYNTEAVPAAEVATLQVFADPKYAGRISLPDNPDDVWALALLATGSQNWAKVTEEEYAAARAWLAGVAPNVRTYWTDGTELAQLMASGEVVLAWAWNETYTKLTAEGHPIAFQRNPAEGTATWFCGYVNMKDGPGSEDLAYDFINAWLDPRAADYLVNEWGYGHGNAAAMAAMDAEALTGGGLGATTAPILAQVPMESAQHDRMLADFEKLKAGF
jgi:spermidine/putrescine transport system substrate-binding protein